MFFLLDAMCLAEKQQHIGSNLIVFGLTQPLHSTGLLSIKLVYRVYKQVCQICVFEQNNGLKWQKYIQKRVDMFPTSPLSFGKILGKAEN